MEQRCATQRGVEAISLPVRARFSAKPRIYMAEEISLKFADRYCKITCSCDIMCLPKNKETKEK